MSVRNNIGIVKNGLVLAFDAANQSSFTLNEVEVLVVGGGGGGGTGGGGGGAGGLVYDAFYKVTSGTNVTVTVGLGGDGVNGWGAAGLKGGNSLFGTITSYGGSGGSHRGPLGGGPFGSGGGDAGAGETIIVGTIGQGKNGGLSKNVTGGTQEEPGGGGGGAGQNGESTASTGGTFGNSTAPRNGIAGKGGDGLYFPQFLPILTNTNGWIAGGGGGCNRSGYGRGGGLGGGGRGGGAGVVAPTAGSPNTGGGGGGTGYSGYGGGGTSAAGGSGIVIVRYPGPQKATGGNTITNVGGYTIHTFTTSGTFTPSAAPANGGAVYGLQDLSGNNNTGTQSGGVTYSSANGGALNFDGVDDYVTLSNVLTNSGNLTYCAWVYRSVVSPNGYTNLFTSTTQNEQFQLDLTGYPGGFGVYLNGAYNSNTSNLIPLNTWVYICWQRNGTGLYGYLNGVEQFNPSTGNAQGNPTVSTAVSNINKIGAYSGGTSYNLNGKLGPVQIYNRALSATEISQNFNALRGRFGL